MTVNRIFAIIFLLCDTTFFVWFFNGIFVLPTVVFQYLYQYAKEIQQRINSIVYDRIAFLKMISILFLFEFQLIYTNLCARNGNRAQFVSDRYATTGNRIDLRM